MRVPVGIKPPKIPYRNGGSNDDTSDDSADESGDESNGEPGDQPNDQPIDQAKGQPKDAHLHLERQDYDAIWSLSKVNHQIRAEVGSLFWNNVYVDIDHFEYLLIDFLQDRPAIHTGIKKLRMSWDCYKDEKDLDHTIVVFCQYLSQHLVLDELIFVLCTSPAIARRILASDGALAWIETFRKINVKKLKVNFFLFDSEDELLGEEDDQDSEEEEEDRYGRLAIEMGPAMEVLLSPAVPPVEITDEDNYLMSRGL
jgi:hypothetical protein